MEKFAVFLLPALIGAALLRLMILPIKLIWKLLIHAVGGLVCLWLLNSLAPFTGFAFPINLISVLIAGTLGVPGILLLAALELRQAGLLP